MERRYKVLLVVATILGIIFGPILGKDHIPLETTIETNPTITMSIEQSNGPYTITYKTTGTLLSHFFIDCDAIGGPWTGDFDPRPNCIDVYYDGKAGIVDLAIPTDLVKGTQSGTLGDVQYGFYKELPFQRLSVDDSYIMIRIDLPAEEHHIRIIGHSSSAFGDLLFFSFEFGAGIFLVVLIGYQFSEACVIKFHQRFRPKPHKI